MSGTTKNFLKVLYETIVPEKLRIVQPEKLKTDPAITENWDYSGKASIPPYRYHSQYNTPLEQLGSVAKYMSRQFNAYCSEANVQCTVAMDPSDFQQLFHFQNLGDRLLLIEYNDEFHYLEPKESMMCKVRQRLDGQPSIPRITPLNNGVSA